MDKQLFANINKAHREIRTFYSSVPSNKFHPLRWEDRLQLERLMRAKELHKFCDDFFGRQKKS